LGAADKILQIQFFALFLLLKYMLYTYTYSHESKTHSPITPQ